MSWASLAQKEVVMSKKKEFNISQDLEITSSKQAFALHKKLESRWSCETCLSQAVEIYIAKLLEEQNALLHQIARKKPSNNAWFGRFAKWWRVQLSRFGSRRTR